MIWELKATSKTQTCDQGLKVFLNDLHTIIRRKGFAQDLTVGEFCLRFQEANVVQVPMPAVLCDDSKGVIVKAPSHGIFIDREVVA